MCEAPAFHQEPRPFPVDTLARWSLRPNARNLQRRVRGHLSFAHRIVRLYTTHMIKSFRHKGLRKFFETGSTAGIQAKHATKLQIQLTALDSAKGPEDMNAPGWKLPPLEGSLSGHWSITVNGNWRLTFTFDGEDAILVDYQDYH